MAQKNLFPILLAIRSPFFPPEGVFSFQAPKADPFISLELKPSQHLLPQLGLFFSTTNTNQQERISKTHSSQLL
jgi:hypothetical protein